MRVLVTEYFHFPIDIRRKEVLDCIEKNVKSGLFDRVIVLSEKDECPVVPDTVITGVRLSYKYTFEYVNKNIPRDHHVFVANSDILFDESIKKVTLDDKTALTLTRWELNPERLHENMVASQDVWGFQTPIRVPPKSDFYFGTYGCDNYIAALLEGEGYTLWNPCLSVKTYHIHASEVRTYEVKPLKPFYNYAFPDPSTLDEEFPASFCTMCNKNCKDELLAMLLSLRKHHPIEPIYVVADSETKQYIEKCAPFLKSVHITKTLDRYNGKDRKQMERDGTWTEFQMMKSRVMDSALMFSSDTLFMDSDILVLDKLRVNKKYDLGVSPHYIKKSETDQHGFFNGGFLWTKNKNVPEDWREFTKTSRFYDQASIEDLAKKYRYFTFDETYNVGWWRLIHSPSDHKEFPKYFWIQGPTYKGRRLKCVHTHFDRNEIFYKDFNSVIIHFLIKSFRWFEMMLVERIINKKWTIMIPEQPLPGKFGHSNDSFRELAPLTAEKVEDVQINTTKGITLPRLGQFVCLYDRPQDGWFTKELEQSLKVFIGNMDASVYDDVRMQPWIFWPRRPRVLEKFLEGPQPEKDIESIFLGNIENEVQAQNRSTKWSDVIKEFHLTNGHKHKFTQDQYLEMMARSKFGLCMKGFGLKCHREVECMALGVVPLVVDGVPMHSYLNPPKEGVHYLRVSTPDDVPKVIKECSNWEEMSKNCHEWYMENVHSARWFTTMLKTIMYKL